MRKPCTIPDCSREAYSRDYCRLHYNRYQATGDPFRTKIRSIEPGAPRDTCEVEECAKIVHARGLCSLHYQRRKATGDPLKTKKAPRGEGLKYREGKLYSVWLWEQHYGPVPEGHHVHHKDEDPSHNVIENLELLTASEHAAHHHRDRLIAQNIANTKWKTGCVVAGCPNVKGLSNGYCPTHRLQIKRHGQVTHAVPLDNSERVKAGWATRPQEKRTWKRKPKNE